MKYMPSNANMRKKQQSYPVPRTVPDRSSVCFNNKTGKTTSSTQFTKPGTWCRDSSPSASSLIEKKKPSTVWKLSESSMNVGTVQNSSYIRKGNSLVRRPSPTAALQGSDGVSTPTYSSIHSGVDFPSDLRNQINSVSIGVQNIAPRKSQVATKPHSPRHISAQLLLPPVDNSVERLETSSDKDSKSSEDAPSLTGTSENQIGPVKSMDSEGEYDKTSVSSILRNIVYVKRKSNQLVAASNPCNLYAQSADRAYTSSSNGYCKKKNNQLVRMTHESLNKWVPVHHESSIPKGQRAHTVTSGRLFSRRWSNKGTSKPSKFSLVWTLTGKQAGKEIDTSRPCQKIFPNLLPWKRGTYWKRLMHNSTNISSTNNLSATSRKLLVSRFRGAVYTRSTRGFSLRKSKVLSLGGRSLKWSMSIGRSSKKANEEATMAIAAAEKKRREENDAARVIYRTNTRNRSSSKLVHGIKLRPGERIYRIGSVSYKMDVSKMTLQRILDDDTSTTTARQEKDIKQPYVPRRLVIGNNQYVRIGNGNQLVRDPKKRTRALASEKVRWSLHTARLRIAKKSKYCQFFTRFGSCNKDNGKCPYIHDPSKITVCTKFLKGLCSNPSCKLTHKVMPERMQDCSYFLQGLCSNEICPYRHVNVNPKASTCEGFLRGYCAAGNECRKKHSYACPVFEASGSCPPGSKCKLHHPKEKVTGKKRKRETEQNAQGRYFGLQQMDLFESEEVVPARHSTKNDDLLMLDYISLNVTDEEIEDTMDVSQNFDEGVLLDGQLRNLDNFVTPFRLID